MTGQRHQGTVALEHRVGPLRVADARVFVETADADFAAVLRWSFRDLAERPDADAPGVTHEFRVRRPSAPRARWSMWRDGESCRSALEEGYVLFHLQWEFNRIVLERRPTTVHAASVEIDGCAVVLVGSSMSGKTTLAGHLATRGAGFVADEIVAVTPQLEAEPYTRPLGLRADGPLQQQFTHPDDFDRKFDSYEMLVPVSSLGPDIEMCIVPAKIDAIVFPKYLPDESTTMTPIRKSEALERLCASSPGLERHGRDVFRRLAALVDAVPSGDLVVSDLEPTHDLIRSIARSH